MAVRTTPSAVQGILVNDWDGTTILTPYIESASSLIDDVVACAARRNKSLSTSKAEILERWMAAYYYTKMDPTYSSRTTAGASGAFIRDPKVPEPYKNAAIELDTSGCLNALLNRMTAGGAWMGKTPNEQINYEDRS